MLFVWEKIRNNGEKINNKFSYLCFMNSRDNMMNMIKEAVRNTDPAAITILYGSRAAGKAKKDSDWDVLILLDQSSVTLQEEQKFRHNLYDLELETGEPISTFVYAANDWNSRLWGTPIFQAVKNNGIIL